MLMTNQARTQKLFPLLFSLLLCAAGILSVFLLRPGAPAQALSNRVVISQQALEQKYGLRINLVALTAAGGMVDLRLKFTDAEKARLLLQDKKNFPALQVGDVTLNVDAETKSQDLKFEDNGGLYLMFPNSGNAVRPGSTLSIVFGDLQVESVVVK